MYLLLISIKSAFCFKIFSICTISFEIRIQNKKTNLDLISTMLVNKRFAMLTIIGKIMFTKGRVGVAKVLYYQEVKSKKKIKGKKILGN